MMKTIGLLGGMSWVATIPYYQRLNELIVKELGNPHSARVLLYSVDYAPLKNLYHHGWDQIPAIFAEEYNKLAAAKPDCIILACNTMHKAVDLAKDQLDPTVPFFHAVSLTTDYCTDHKIEKPLFLGTTFTMTDDYFMRPLREAGLDLVLPTDEDKAQIQAIQSDVSKGYITDQHRQTFADIINRYPRTDAVILACTELPLIAPNSTTEKPMINPAELQCLAAVQFALKT